MSEDLALRPKQQAVDVFDRMVRGYYGQFKSDKSYPLSYIQGSIPIDNINWLETASEAFRSHNLDFEELIQRDINKKRVREIVDTYLKKGEERVLFFPPLLASVVAVNDDGLVNQYERVDEVVDEDSVKITWGDDRFQLVVPRNTVATGHQMVADGQQCHTTPYWSVLRVNSQKIKLVIIDGQHRLQALKSLWNSSDSANRKVVKDLTIPVCVLFSPDAVKGTGTHESLSRDMRELFVRINSEGKKVSGHFITLLNDNRLSSYAVREFCNHAKSEEVSHGLNLLNTIEWNQREDRLASQINRPFSITTIQIIADVLKEHAFDPKSAGKTRYLLDLKAYRDELEGLEAAVQVGEISEENFSVSQVEVLQRLIKESVVPSLAILFFEPKVYQQRVSALGKAGNWLSGRIADAIEGAEYCKVAVLDQYRDANDLDPDSSRVMYKEFCDKVSEVAPLSIHFYNVFQQGLVRAWISLCRALFDVGSEPQYIARALISSLDEVMSVEDPRFDSVNLYTQKLLFNGGKVLLHKRAKRNWKNLIIANLANQSVRKKFITSLGVGDDVDRIIGEKAEESLHEYLRELRKVIEDDYRKYWRDKELDEQVVQELEDLESSAAKGDEEAESRLDSIISEFSGSRHKEAERKLKAVFGI